MQTKAEAQPLRDIPKPENDVHAGTSRSSLEGKA